MTENSERSNFTKFTFYTVTVVIMFAHIMLSVLTALLLSQMVFVTFSSVPYALAVAFTMYIVCARVTRQLALDLSMKLAKFLDVA